MYLKVDDAMDQIKASILASRRSCVQSCVQNKQVPIKQDQQQVQQAKNHSWAENGLAVFKLNTRYLRLQYTFTLLLLNYFTLLFTYYQMQLSQHYHISDILWTIFISSLGLGVCSFYRFLGRKELAEARREKPTNYKYEIFQIILLFIQPYPWLRQITITRLTHQNQQISPLKINNLLFVLSMTKIIFVLRGLLIYITPYSDPRHHRVSKIYGTQHSYIYQIKCLFRYHPVILISSLYLFSLLFFACCYRVFQSGVQGKANLNSFQNSVWLAMISMTSVGYGDIAPSTTLGGYVTVVSSFVGVIGTSLFVLSITNNLQLDYRQERSLQILKRFGSYQKIKQKSAKLIAMSLSRKWKKFKYKRNIAVSNQQRLLSRQLNQLRYESKKVLKQSSLLQQVMQQQFQIAKHHIDQILNNCEQILNQCSNKQQIIDGVLKDMYQGKQKEFNKMGLSQLLGLNQQKSERSIHLSPAVSMQRLTYV